MAKRIECRLKVNLIGENKVAIELSDGIWGSLTVKQMNVYMNTYLKKKNRGSWSNLAPAELWSKVQVINMSYTSKALGKVKVTEQRLTPLAD